VFLDKVVVIGGGGFMGSHTADELTRRGYRVVLFDKYGSDWKRDDQEMQVGDVLNMEALLQAFEGARFVYHFAGIADIEEARSRPFDTVNLNVVGVATTLEAAISANVERFLFASTMYVYSPYGSFYRASKQAAETIIEAYSEQFPLDYTLLRYGSLYGPRAQPWNGLRKYVTEIVRTGRLEYPGSGRERREYIHVKDAARLSVDILDEKHRNKAITVTGAQVLTSAELLDLIFEIAGKRRDVEFLERNKKDHYSMTPYRYTPKQAKKIVPDEFVDIGEGVLEVVQEVYDGVQD